MALFIVSIFLSATLLFLVQPMMAKVLLPYFGGSAAVWTACMLFFQLLLLAGYCYAHWLSRLGSLQRQLLLHSSLLLLSLLWLPWLGQITTAGTSSQPAPAIIALLFISVGGPYLMLSATGPLLQRWFSQRFPLRSPYRLYALSNLGSLGGLISYPFLVEPWLPLAQQNLLWAGGYGLFSLLCLALLWRTLWPLASSQPLLNLASSSQASGWQRWLALSACGVVLLLAITHEMTQNISPVPFLWIVPLCLYLLSYILAFGNEHWYQRTFWLYLFVLGLVMALILIYFGRLFDLVSQLVLYLVILFSGCMLCHGELARLKPQVQQLTGFYLALALGGVLGGAAVSLLAPQLFSQFWEFPLVLLLIYLLVVSGQQQSRWLKAGWLAGGLLFAGSFVLLEWQFSRFDLHNSRNFYGKLTVRDVQLADQPQRQLIDGTTSHGAQYLADELRHIPLSYYRPSTGIALALQQFVPASPLRQPQQLQQRKVGIIGLGAGALASYGQAGDQYRFYELNLDVTRIANQYFSYLADSQADISIADGDGRLQLAAELATAGSQQYDILVLDAFSSDAIPLHLLTWEAFSLYWQHLMDDGILAVHISNNYLDLTSVLRNHAQVSGKQAFFIHTPADTDNPAATEWLLITSNSRFSRLPALQQMQSPWPAPLNPTVKWTDQYSNLLQVLK